MKILATLFFTVPEIGTLFCSVSTCELEICTCMMRSHHMITVIVLAFLTQENKASKMQSTINQLKHGKGCAVRDNGTHRTVITALPSML